ncbi:MAG: hypothetical protein HYX73_07005 [Acidobacteria bacterium]|nr:hypothetical protein [Acidobacteriota bacterium]
MMARLAILVLVCSPGAVLPAHTQDDYLTEGEISAVRDAQEPDKRMILWMDLAQRRLDAVKQAVATLKPESGRAIQESLDEYIHIMEALESTILDARDRRVPLSKGLKDVEERGNLYLNYLRTLNSEAIPGWKDFEYTLEEAMDMTKDQLAEVAKGNYPEVRERTPPTDLPPPSARPPSKSAPQEAPREEGPPRKSQRGS